MTMELGSSSVVSYSEVGSTLWLDVYAITLMLCSGRAPYPNNIFPSNLDRLGDFRCNQ